MVEQHHPEVRFRRRYVSNCDVCGEISSNTRLRRALAQVLRDNVDQLLPDGKVHANG